MLHRLNEIVDTVHWAKGMRRRQIYKILKKVKDGKNPDDQRHSKPTKTVLTGQ
jgi:hypothetical protein